MPWPPGEVEVAQGPELAEALAEPFGADAAVWEQSMRCLIRTMYGSSYTYGISTLYEMSRDDSDVSDRPPRPRSPSRRAGRADLDRPSRPGGAPPRSRDDIAEAAVAVADADGLDAVSMRRVASELGLGTMSLYHYVRSKDELLDLMGDRIAGGQLVDEADLRRGWREGLTAIAQATRANLKRHPWMGGALSPRPTTIPGPNTLRHVDQSLAAVADLGLDVPTQMEIIAVVDDYVIGFVVRSQRVAEYEEDSTDTVAEWMDAAFGHLRSQIESGAFPHLQRAIEANRAAGRPATRISGAWPRARSASSAGSSSCSTASRRSSPSRSSGVVEDDAERRAPAAAHRRHAVAHRRAVEAARPLHRPVAGREDQEGAALEVDRRARVTARAGAARAARTGRLQSPRRARSSIVTTCSGKATSP